MCNKVFRILFFIIALSYPVTGQCQSNFINYRIFPSAVTQTEPVFCISPLNHQILFVSAVTINTATTFRSEGIYFSTNGGANWFGSDTCKGSNINNHGGSPGIAIDNNGIFIMTHIGLIIPGVYSHYSTDYGANWSNAFNIIYNQSVDDKGTTSADYETASPYFGRLYSARAVFINPFPIFFSYSSNGGTSWTSSVAINNPPPQRCSGGSVKSNFDGKLYVCWAGVSNISPFTENFIGFASSTNGGDNWSVTQNIYSVNGINGTLPSKSNIRVNGLPVLSIDKSNGPRRGWLYIVTTEKNLSPAGSDPDIILHYSSNGGTNWSAGIRVNQDALNNGKIQYFPAIDVDSTGAVNILFYDDRNTSSDSAEVFLARSKDGGTSWSELVVSNNRFKPKPIAGGAAGYQGDHISLQASGGKLYALWMDDYSGLYQIWIASLDISTIGITNITTIIPDKFNLYQNYPNPFNPVTNIRFEIPSDVKRKTSDVKLTIYDIVGKEIVALVNEELNPGSYEVKFDGTNLPSGIYFYRLTTDDFSQTKKMFLIK